MDRPDPWEAFSREHRQDERFTATITKIVDFGIFVGLEGGIDGLVHISDISWSKPGETAIKRYAVGDHIEVSILSIDVDMQRISLGIKQCTTNPYQAFADQHSAGDHIVGRIHAIKVTVFVDLPGGVSGTVKNAPIGVERFGLGDEIDLVILDISVRRSQIWLGLKSRGDGPAAQVVEPNRPIAPKPILSAELKP